MTVNSDLAQAARRARSLAERLPAACRPDLSFEWSRLLNDIEDVPDYEARPIIAAWTTEIEERLTVALVHAPLREGPA